MTIHYIDGGPFETTYATVGPATIVGYDAKAKTFLAMCPTGKTFWGMAANFDPPPPIPAAARKPQMGEVWIADKYGACMLLDWSEASSCWQVSKVAGLGTAWLSRQQLIRPATPEEAAPFRRLLDGLKRSLSET